MKSSLLEKAQRKLSNAFPDYEYDEDLLGDYFDDAVLVIKKWKKNYNDSVVLSGRFDTDIVQFIVESINKSGVEGQYSSSANGISKVFISTPEDNLKAKIPQGL